MADDVKIRITATTDDLQAAVDRAREHVQEFDQAVARSSDSVKEASRSYQQTIDDLTGVGRANSDAAASASVFAQALGEPQPVLDQTSNALKNFQQANDVATESVTHAHGAAATATREFRALFDELSSGRTRQTPGTLAIIANSVFGLSGSALIATGAVVGVGLAIAGVVEHAEALDRELGTMQAALDASGRGADYTRDGIVNVIAALRDLPGVSTKAAEQLVTDFSRQRDIGVGSYEDLGKAAAGFARVTGDELPKAGGTLAKALEEGSAAILKLDASYNFLTPTQRALIVSFGETGDKAGVLNIAIPALTDHFSRFVGDGMTPMQLASEGLGAAWDRMLDALHNTAPIEAARAAITGLLNDAARGLKDSYDPTNLDHLKSDLAALQSQRDRLQGEHDGFLGGIVAPQSVIDGLDQQIAKTKELIAAREQAQAPKPATLPNGENDPTVIIKQSLELEQQLGLEAAKREQIEGRIAELKRGADAATSQATQASNNGDSSGAASYQAQATRLTADAAELQNQLDNLHGKGGEKRIQQWQDQLDQQLLAQNKFGEDAKQAEVTFWQARLAETTAGTAEQLAVERRLYQARSSLQSEQAADAKRADAEADADAKARFDADVSTLRDQQAAHKDDYAVRIAIEDQILAKFKEFYGDDTKAYGDELKRKEDLLQQSAAQRQRIAEITANGEAERAKLKETADSHDHDSYGIGGLVSGQPSDDLASKQSKLKSDSDAQQAALSSSLATATSPVDQTTIYQKMLTAQAQYNSKSQALNQQAAASTERSWQNVLAPVDRAFTSSINGMLTGTQTLSQGVARAGQSIVLSFVDAAEKSLVKWVASELAKLTITETTQAGMTAATGANQAAQTAIKAEGKAAEGAMDSGSILNNAYTAASGAYAAVAGIPYVGPVLAPVAAAAAYAGVLAFDVISAAGGMASVPFDDMPALLHKNEMVLPASIASPLRTAIGSWGMPQTPAANANLPTAAGSGGSGGIGELHLHAPMTVTGGNPVDVQKAALTALDKAVRHGVPSQYPNLKKLMGS